eukprot:gnl/TRDRNA2_/TRDRNA2_162796_c0_seq1.p1 gnl/TRDRNA2_/TRDRNA2_162796_c0~~gnl/TRDRNA2_/TRDRNA2_162796_c0_seq1.p1  ORF type:complete len:127 (-),score=10.04 gnl/TRDRNA2_/TRDRNA2_162796_c0_seq1:413-793(-)
MPRAGIDVCTERFEDFSNKIRWATIRLTFIRRLVMAGKLLSKNAKFKTEDSQSRMVDIIAGLKGEDDRPSDPLPGPARSSLRIPPLDKLQNEGTLLAELARLRHQLDVVERLASQAGASVPQPNDP